MSGFFAKALSVFVGAPVASPRDEDVKIEPLKTDKKTPTGSSRDASRSTGGSKVERSEPPMVSNASLRFVAPSKDVFMEEVDEVIGIMMNMGDIISENYELMSDDERREVVASVRSMRMFLKHGKSLQPTDEVYA
jgi:hypothetical protein